MSDQVQLLCGSCKATLQDGDRFCEQCGARLTEDESSVGTGSVADRVELDLTIAAVVSDQGRVHRRNEDAFHLELVGERSGAAVICDGISSASAGDAAARIAANAAGTVLVGAIADPSREIGELMVEAVDAAQAAVERVPWTSHTDRAVPSCTLVSAAWRRGEIVVGWVGDSRAYWIASRGTQQLTADDSWAQEQIDDGLLTAKQAFSDPRAHSITHWVGADAPDRPPQVVLLAPDRSGRLILCTDGLWNYAPSPPELGALIEALPPGAAPAAVARALTDTALERGGRDNITVAVIDIDPS